VAFFNSLLCLHVRHGRSGADGECTDGSGEIECEQHRHPDIHPGHAAWKHRGYFYYTLNQSSGLAVSLSQASPQFQSTVGANLAISNSVSGQICVVECASFGGSLESYNASLNIVSTSTANNGTVSFLGIPAPDVNGLSIPLVITSPGKLPVTDAGSIEVNPPSSLSGSGSLPAGLSVSSNTTVGQLSIDLGKFAASLTGNKYLAPEANYSYDGFGISYDIASATLNLSETLSQTDSVSLQSVNSTVSFYNAKGNPVSLSAFTPGGIGPGSSGPTYFGQFDQLEFGGDGNLTTLYVGDNGQNLAGDYAVESTTYQLTMSEVVDLLMNGDLDFAALSGSLSGFGISAGFGPIFSYDIPFDTSASLVTDTQTFDFTETQIVSFSGNPVTLPVPEPPSWAVMLLGIGGIGAAMRRARKRPYARAWRSAA